MGDRAPLFSAGSPQQLSGISLQYVAPYLTVEELPVAVGIDQDADMVALGKMAEVIKTQDIAKALIK